MVLKQTFSVDQTSYLMRLLMLSFFSLSPSLFLWSKSSRLKSKPFLFFGLIVLRFGSHPLALLVEVGLVKPIRTPASTRYIVAAIWLHVSSITSIHVQWQVLIFAVFLRIIQSLWNGSFIDWGFLHSPLMIQYLPPERLWYQDGFNRSRLIVTQCFTIL